MHLLEYFAVSLLFGASQAFTPEAADIFKLSQKKHYSSLNRRFYSQGRPILPRQIKYDQPSSYGSKFLNNASRKFIVNGSALPDVNFNVGESYAGLLPISDAADETRELFFWFFPSTNPDATNKTTIWLTGGPGCSSLSALLTENGPFTWSDGTLSPIQNPYSWTNLTNMLWVEQPVGVGFSRGVPNITNEVELSLEFIGFYKQFVDTFKLHGGDTYITGESYGGYFVPYIADSFLSHADDKYYKLKGIAINDPIIGSMTLQSDVVTAPYVDYWSNVLYLNDTFTKSIHARADECGYTDFFNTYFKFPPPGPFPRLHQSANSTVNCDIGGDVLNAASEVNSCFNPYRITETCPNRWPVLGAVNPGDYVPPGEVVYFTRTDVQKAINAPAGANWTLCNENVFATSAEGNTTFDTSTGPAKNGVLQRVIEATNNVIIGSGNLDILLPTNGTLFAIQNMTWHGLQGFQEYPGKKFVVPHNGGNAGAANLGSWGSERGLTFYQVQLAGHQLPGHAAGAAYRVIELLVGRIKDLSA